MNTRFRFRQALEDGKGGIEAGLMRTKLMIYPKGDVPVAPVQTSLQLNVNRGYLYREYFQRPDHSPRQAVKPAMF